MSLSGVAESRRFSWFSDCLNKVNVRFIYFYFFTGFFFLKSLDTFKRPFQISNAEHDIGGAAYQLLGSVVNKTANWDSVAIKWTWNSLL